MENALLKLINDFGKYLSKHEYNQYIPKLRDYLVQYIIEHKDNELNIKNLFENEFTRNDIKKSTIFYIVENQNVRSISAIDDFLIALNRFFDEFIFIKYPNTNLMKIQPFTSLHDEIIKSKTIIDLNLKEKDKFPPISDDENHPKFILSYIDNIKRTLKSIQVIIIIKLMMLYGLSHSKISNLKIDNYDNKKRTLLIECSRSVNINIELPYSLANDIKEYLEIRSKKHSLTSQWLFISNRNNQIQNSFYAEILDSIKEEYKTKNCCISTEQCFTPTGLQKYAIINMILNGMNQSVIMDFTGFSYDILDDCQDYVNQRKDLNRNRYINYKIRGIPTFEHLL